MPPRKNKNQLPLDGEATDYTDYTDSVCACWYISMYDGRGRRRTDYTDYTDSVCVSVGVFQCLTDGGRTLRTNGLCVNLYLFSV